MLGKMGRRDDLSLPQNALEQDGGSRNASRTSPPRAPTAGLLGMLGKQPGRTQIRAAAVLLAGWNFRKTLLAGEGR